MNKPLTPDEVKELKLPEGYELYRNGTNGTKWHIRVFQRSAYRAPNTESLDWALAALACSVANGTAKKAALDAVWAIVEGRVEFVTTGMDYTGSHYGGHKTVSTHEIDNNGMHTHLLLQVKP